MTQLMTLLSPRALSSALYGITLALAACGESSSSPDDMATVGGAMTAGGGSAGVTTGGQVNAGQPASGGSALAGTSSGGTAEGGTSVAGSAAGEAMSAGSSSGGYAGKATGGGASTADQTIVPDASWACGHPEGLVSPTRGKLLLEATFELGETRDIGTTQYGKRRLLDVKGGTIQGEKLSANVLTGGLELELTLSNGNVELEQIDVLRADDGALVYLRSCGVAPAGSSEVRVAADFEVATSSAHAWLNDSKLVGTRTIEGTRVVTKLYDVSGVSPAEPKVTLQDPENVPNQAWECATADGTKGDPVFSEAVTLGGSLSVGASKRGTRNVIPITGGTLSGKLTGTVRAGGADYQLIGNSTKLDARYSLQTEDEEVILVRNCGAFGALIPTFEARTDGPHAFLNQGKFASSDPGSAAGGVSITFYELK